MHKAYHSKLLFWGVNENFARENSHMGSHNMAPVFGAIMALLKP